MQTKTMTVCIDAQRVAKSMDVGDNQEQSDTTTISRHNNHTECLRDDLIKVSETPQEHTAAQSFPGDISRKYLPPHTQITSS